MTRDEMIIKLELNIIDKKLGYHLATNPNALMADGVKSVTIHQTDNPSVGADAEAHHNYQANGAGGVEKSWHYTVDEKDIYQSYRDDRITWHTASKSGNDTSIGIELCMDADKVGEPIMGEPNYRKTIDNGAKLAAILLVEYGLAVADLKQHFDWSGKNCPSKIRAKLHGIGWDEFKGMVAGYYKILTYVAPVVVLAPVVKPVLAPEGKLYQVALAAFKDKANAADLVSKAKALGLSPYLVLINDPRYTGGK